MPSPFVSPFRPQGNPAALLAAARKCLALAHHAEGLDTQLVKALPSGAFKGPARGDIDAAIRTAALQSGRGASDLVTLAKTLSDGAETLKRAQKAWDDAQDEWDRALQRERSGRAG